jgi:hypothetical protein
MMFVKGQYEMKFSNGLQLWKNLDDDDDDDDDSRARVLESI